MHVDAAGTRDLDAAAAATIVQRLALAPCFPMDRLSLRLLVLGTATALAASCTLITDVDRSKIPEPPVVAPDPLVDAGVPQDAAVPPASADDGDAATDAGPDAAPGDAGVLDGGSSADAQADGG